MGKLTQQPAIGATNTAAQILLDLFSYIFAHNGKNVPFFHSSGVFRFKSLLLPSLYGGNKKKTSLNLTHLIFDTKFQEESSLIDITEVCLLIGD